MDRRLDAYAAEFIGTLLLVFFIGMTFVLNSVGGLGVTDFAVIGLVHLLVLAVLVHTLGAASGGHFNPAVTIALAALRRIGPVDALVYVGLQLAGALGGALLVRVLLSEEGVPAGYGAVEVSDRFLQGDALPGTLAELMGTFLLMWAVMGVAARRGAREWAGLVIGGALGVAVMTIAPLTGGGFNPARAIGPNLIAERFAVFDGAFLLTYVVGPVAGALLAALAYTALIVQPGERAALHGERAPVDAFAEPAPAGEHRPVDRLD